MTRNPTNVFVVDDDVTAAAEIADRLRLEGIVDVQQFASAEAALKTMATHTPTAIITDVVMPGMSGVEFCERAKKLCPQAIIQIVSGSSLEKLRPVFGNVDADLFTQKPLKSNFYKAFLKFLGYRMTTPGVLDTFTNSAKARWGYDPNLEAAVRIELYGAALGRIPDADIFADAFWYRQANFLDAMTTSYKNVPSFDMVVGKIPAAVIKKMKLQHAKIRRLNPAKLNEYLMMQIVNPILYGEKKIEGGDFESWKSDAAELFCHTRIRSAGKDIFYYMEPMKDAQQRQIRSAVEACEELRFYSRNLVSVPSGNAELIVPPQALQTAFDEYRRAGGDPEVSSSFSLDASRGNAVA